MSAPTSSPTNPVTPTAPATKPPSASLYVGDLFPEVNEGALFELFNTVGPVSSIRVCRDTLTRRSLGYAYVNFHSVVDAERALDTLNNVPVSGKPCRIMWSQRDPSVRKTGVGNIFIKNLAPNIGHKELYDTFSAFGNILSCKVALDENGESKGYGFVHFENQSAAEAAVETVNNNLLLDKKVYVGPFIPRKVRAQQLEKSWTNLFIKDLDPSIDDEALRKAFSEHGTVTSAVVMQKDNVSLGFGFVNFETHEAAADAVANMHGKKLGNKQLYCCRAQKKAEREARLKREWEQLKISKYQGINLYIKNLEDEVDEERLRKEFSAFGAVKSCKIMGDENGTSKGFGFVCFSAPEESQRAITEMNNRILPGCSKPLYVALHEPKEVRRQKLTINAIQGLRSGAVPGAVYHANQPVYYSGGNISAGYVPYPSQQQMMPGMPRGWQPQYPMHAGPAYPSGPAVPRGGNNSAPQGANVGGSGRGARGGPSGRGGARGANVGGGGGRRVNQAQSGSPAGVESQQNIAELTLQQLLLFPEDHQKLLIGERIYPLIAASRADLAGKITGMLLDAGWGIEELYSLITDPAKLNDKIVEAVGVLERASANEEATNQ